MATRWAHKYNNRKENKQINYTYSEESEDEKLRIVFCIF
jgi:hypothetical protein